MSKHFGATQALQEINLNIERGTIHALVGENGAGKSTALGILAGRLAPSSGEVVLFGETVTAMHPRDARRMGLAAIYQELTIVPELSAEANVFVGQPAARFGLLAGRAMRRRYEELCEQLGVRAAAPGTAAGSLSVAEQQLLEIMRAMAFEAKLILFDEPTASLGIPERRALIALMKQMRADGRTLVFVSHNIDEVLDVSDTVTVFRTGRCVTTMPRGSVTKREVVRQMLGENADLRLLRSLEEGSASPAPARRAALLPGRPPMLRVEDLNLPGVLEDVSFEVRAGEILGLGGLVGAGRTEILRSIAGLEPRASGEMWVHGKQVPWPKSVRRARGYGIALAPEDRKTQGLVLEMSAATNVTMSDLRAVSRGGIVSPTAVRRAAEAAVGPFSFDRTRVGERAIRLSGGNQQKLLLARWKHSEPALLLADEPTRGIDIGAKEEVLSALEEMASRGMAVILVASELEELVAISDRVDVISEGRLVGRLDRQSRDLTVSEILDKAFSVGGST